MNKDERAGHKWNNLASIHFLVAQSVKNLPAVQETLVWSLGWEDPLEKEMATHSSTLAWKIPWMEEPDRLQSMGSQSRTRLSDFTSKVCFILCDFYHNKKNFFKTTNAICHSCQMPFSSWQYFWIVASPGFVEAMQSDSLPTELQGSPKRLTVSL